MSESRVNRFTPPHQLDTCYRTNKNEAWLPCALCGGRLWPESMTGEHEGRRYCNAHLDALLANLPECGDISEDRRGSEAKPTVRVGPLYGECRYGTTIYGAGLVD